MRHWHSTLLVSNELLTAVGDTETDRQGMLFDTVHTVKQFRTGDCRRSCWPHRLKPHLKILTLLVLSSLLAGSLCTLPCRS